MDVVFIVALFIIFLWMKYYNNCENKENTENKENVPQAFAQPVQSKNGESYATASMVLGIAAIVFVFIFWFISPICAVVSLVMSHIAKTRGYTGSMRTAGLVLSWVAIVLSILVTAGFVWIYQFISSMDWTHGNFADPESFFR